MMLIVSQGLLWIVVLLLAVAMLALVRQLGVLHERIAPAGALTLGRGPQPGEAAPRVAAAVKVRRLSMRLCPRGHLICCCLNRA